MRKFKIFSLPWLSILSKFNIWINFIMAWSAKSNPIIFIKSQFRKIQPWFNMMSSQKPPGKFLFALLADIFIPIMDFSFPKPIPKIFISANSFSFIIPRVFPKHWITFTHSFFRKLFSIIFIRTIKRTKFSFTFQIWEFIKNSVTFNAIFIKPFWGVCFAHHYEYNISKEVMQYDTEV